VAEAANLKTIPRWAILAGFGILVAAAAWLTKLLLAGALLAIGGLYSLLDPFSPERLQVSCLAMEPGGTVLESDLILTAMQELSPGNQTLRSLRSISTLAASSCSFLNGYLEVSLETVAEGNWSGGSAATFDKLFEEFFQGVMSAHQIEFAKGEALSQGGRTNSSSTSYARALNALASNEANLRAALVMNLHLSTLSKDEFWFVGFQNLAEARATGGMLSNYAIVRLGPSGLVLEEKGGNLDLMSKGGSSISGIALEGFSTLGADPLDWRDINSFPDEEATFQSIVRSWQANSSISISGVIMLGQGVVAKIVAGTGYLDVGRKILTAGDALSFFSGEIYAFEQDKVARDKLLSEMLGQALESIDPTSLNLTALVEYASSATDGDRVQVWAVDNDMATALGGSAGGLSKRSFAVSLNNVGANKLDRYTRISATLCRSKTSKLYSMSFVISNTAPLKGLPDHVAPEYFAMDGREIPRGTARLQFMLTAPRDFQLVDFFSTSGLEVFPILELEGSRSIVLEAQIPPGQQVAHNFVFMASDSEASAAVGFSPLLNAPSLSLTECE